jgi:gamma-glutamyltranspeptidase / glutathione hydrolase
MAARVALTATGPVALAAGLAMADAGGNAVDVAVAAAVAAMACEPGIVSLLGGAFVSVWPAGAEPEVIDGNVEMPGRGAAPERFGQGVVPVTFAYGGGVTMHGGAGSVAIPGALPALALARERHGRLPWSELVAPAAQACRTGYPIGSAAAAYLGFTHEALFGLDDEAHALAVAPDGTPWQSGDLATNPALADVLDTLAAEGVALFTHGAVAAALVADMADRGGLITADDLAAYAPLVRAPVRRQLGDWAVAINPPPSVGGPMLAVMLGELAARGAWTLEDVIEVQHAVLSFRHAVHDFSTDLDADGRALLAAVERYGLAGLPTSSSTAHVSAVDVDGLACAITMSSGYLSGTAVPGTGLLYNNALGEPELTRRGLHAVRPGTRLASNMAPTTARAADGRVLAIGSPGADRITTALQQVLARHCLRGDDLAAAIVAPRVHVRPEPGGGGTVEFEADETARAAVVAAGLTPHEHPERSMYFGGVGAAGLGAAGLVAAGDPRRELAVGTR